MRHETASGRCCAPIEKRRGSDARENRFSGPRTVIFNAGLRAMRGENLAPACRHFMGHIGSKQLVSPP